MNNKTEKHIIQYAKGNILFGNAGLTNKDISNGYICMLCSVDEHDRFVDIALTKGMMLQIIEGMKQYE